VDFFVDGDHVRTVEQAEHAGHVPRFDLDYVREA
jgi:hypothetical protein